MHADTARVRGTSLPPVGVGSNPNANDQTGAAGKEPNQPQPRPKPHPVRWIQRGELTAMIRCYEADSAPPFATLESCPPSAKVSLSETTFFFFFRQV